MPIANAIIIASDYCTFSKLISSLTIFLYFIHYLEVFMVRGAGLPFRIMLLRDFGPAQQTWQACVLDQARLTSPNSNPQKLS